MIKMSVVVPVFNEESYLGFCLDSLINQSEHEIEIICVNDGSTDVSGKIIKGYMAQDKRVVLIDNKKNMGVAYSRNAAIKQCKGKYVMFVDSDDYLTSNAIEQIVSYCECHSLDMCFYKFIVDTGNNTRRVSNGICGVYDNIYSGEELLGRFANNHEFFLYMCSACYKRCFLQENDLFINDLIIGEGGDFILRCLLTAKSVGVLNERVYYYRIHSGSTNSREDSAEEALWGRFIQLSNVIRVLSSCKKSAEISSFIEYYQKKVIGGLKLLESPDQKKYLSRCRDDFEKVLFKVLNTYDIYRVDIGQELINRCNGCNNVFVYGLGYATEAVLVKLSDNNISTEGIIVSQYTGHRRVYMGHRVYRVDDKELVSKKNDAVVVVAAHKRHNKSIYEICKNNGFENLVFLDIEF